jgi:hypothetical protein
VGRAEEEKTALERGVLHLVQSEDVVRPTQRPEWAASTPDVPESRLHVRANVRKTRGETFKQNEERPSPSWPERIMEWSE